MRSHQGAIYNIIILIASLLSRHVRGLYKPTLKLPAKRVPACLL
jgi:hypothetical protein